MVKNAIREICSWRRRYILAIPAALLLAAAGIGWALWARHLHSPTSHIFTKACPDFSLASKSENAHGRYSGHYRSRNHSSIDGSIFHGPQNVIYPLPADFDDAIGGDCS